ncbi:heme-dependent oxidative N-demethylase family protein [Mesorhizobium sp. L-8-10]|uniref:heme-dependent oxidative N-demethylase family protein n=1 Tax=Mesorhizobium sp. L-8-10 TaxID=2744523 RepID=UPI00192908B5|nr:DUF3445 domain-containing protein [Mesorhizobium sp. L-8-10]
MSVTPTHTPYDGSTKPFTIGLKPLDLDEWIEVDDDIDAYLAEKDRLHAQIPDKVFVEERDTRQAQQEVLDLLASYLPSRFPETYRRDGDALLVGRTRRQILDDGSPPLLIAARLVQEDLVLMRKGEDGWRLAAATLCFPASWSLQEKIGRPLQDIHAPVPGFGRGTRTADIIGRIFDNLAAARPVERRNWSLQAGGDLYKPLSGAERTERAVVRPSRFPEADIAAHAFMRVERQTLRKLPESGDILFTIRTYLDPIERLARHPDRARIAASFADQLAALEGSQLDYKGLTADRDRLVSALRTIAADAT